MRVQDIMTEGVETVGAADTAEFAWQLMRQKAIRHLLVREGGEVVGVLSSRDVGGPNGVAVRRNRSVADLMTRDVICVLPTTTTRQAANLMRGRSIGSLIVGSPKRPVGIITVADLLDLIGHGEVTPAPRPNRALLQHRAPHRKRHVAAGAW